MPLVILLHRCCSAASPVQHGRDILRNRSVVTFALWHWTLRIVCTSIKCKLQRGLHLFGSFILSNELALTDELRSVPRGLDMCWRRGSSRDPNADPAINTYTSFFAFTDPNTNSFAYSDADSEPIAIIESDFFGDTSSLDGDHCDSFDATDRINFGWLFRVLVSCLHRVLVPQEEENDFVHRSVEAGEAIY